MSTSEIPTPAKCTADFCLIPVSIHNHTIIVHVQSANRTSQMGTSSPSVSAQIADVQRLIEKSDLKYTMHSAGTTLGNLSPVEMPDW